MDKKYIYVLSQSHITGYKVGYTNDVSRRLKELQYMTTSPGPFKCEFLYEVSDPRFVEANIHKVLNEYRTYNRKEFFNIDLRTIVKVIKSFPGEVINLPLVKKDETTIGKKEIDLNNFDIRKELYRMFKKLCDGGLTTREAEAAMGLSRRSYYRYKKIYG
jgi:hypothetical protein